MKRYPRGSFKGKFPPVMRYEVYTEGDIANNRIGDRSPISLRPTETDFSLVEIWQYRGNKVETNEDRNQSKKSSSDLKHSVSSKEVDRNAISSGTSSPPRDTNSVLSATSEQSSDGTSSHSHRSNSIFSASTEQSSDESIIEPSVASHESNSSDLSRLIESNTTLLAEVPRNVYNTLTEASYTNKRHKGNCMEDRTNEDDEMGNESSEESKMTDEGYKLWGKCPECNEMGMIGTYCTDCEDTGLIYC